MSIIWKKVLVFGWGGGEEGSISSKEFLSFVLKYRYSIFGGNELWSRLHLLVTFKLANTPPFPVRPWLAPKTGTGT